MQRKLVQSGREPTDWEELQSKALASRTAPSRAKIRKEPSSFCRGGCGGVAMCRLLVELGLPCMNAGHGISRLEEQSVSVLKSALYHDSGAWKVWRGGSRTARRGTA